MDFLKELPSALSKVVEPVFGNSRLCFIAFVGLTLLLGLPEQWLVPVGLDVVQVRYRWIVGLVWFVFGLASVYHLVRFIEFKWQASRGLRDRARMQKWLRRLTEEQKGILKQFIDNDGLSVRLRVSRDVRDLAEAGVLVSPLSDLGVHKDLGEEGLFWVDSWALKYLLKHRDLLE